MARILLVEDQALAGAGLAAALECAGHAVELARELHAARLLLACQVFDALITDVDLPDGEGPLLLMHPQVRRRRCPVWVVTGEGSAAAAALRQHPGVVAVYEKPVAPHLLVADLACHLGAAASVRYPSLISPAERDFLLTRSEPEGGSDG